MAFQQSPAPKPCGDASQSRICIKAWVSQMPWKRDVSPTCQQACGERRRAFRKSCRYLVSIFVHYSEILLSRWAWIKARKEPTSRTDLRSMPHSADSASRSGSDLPPLSLQSLELPSLSKGSSEKLWPQTWRSACSKLLWKLCWPLQKIFE